MSHPHGKRTHFRSFLLHFRPRSVPERTLRFSLTWGLGGTALVLVLLLLGSGLMLSFVYEPFPDKAYASIIYLHNNVSLGILVRNIHWLSANTLILVAFLHMLRVFYSGAFLAPRQLNWIVGLVIFAAIVFSNFTGYLLPWDQVAYWAITISTSMLDYLPGVGTTLKEWVLGGTEPGPGTLVNFYAIHTAVLPAILLIALPFHFWRIRKAGGLVIPRTAEEDSDTRGEMVDTLPHLIFREAAMAIVVIAAILIVAMFFNAPLAEQANPGLSPNPTKAPWYFMGIQELLMHFHPVFAILVIPLALLLGLISIPYLRYEINSSGVWFVSRKGLTMVLIAAFVAILGTVSAVMMDEFVIAEGPIGPPDMINAGLLPVAVIVALCAGFYVLMKKGFKASNNEAIQALFTLLTVAFVVLTVIGIWFRGTGMQLMWAGW